MIDGELSWEGDQERMGGSVVELALAPQGCSLMVVALDGRPWFDREGSMGSES
jgi:hypothetical protein